MAMLRSTRGYPSGEGDHAGRPVDHRYSATAPTSPIPVTAASVPSITPATIRRRSEAGCGAMTGSISSFGGGAGAPGERRGDPGDHRERLALQLTPGDSQHLGAHRGQSGVPYPVCLKPSPGGVVAVAVDLDGEPCVGPVAVESVPPIPTWRCGCGRSVLSSSERSRRSASDSVIPGSASASSSRRRAAPGWPSARASSAARSRRPTIPAIWASSNARPRRRSSSSAARSSSTRAGARIGNRSWTRRSSAARIRLRWPRMPAMRGIQPSLTVTCTGQVSASASGGSGSRPHNLAALAWDSSAPSRAASSAVVSRPSATGAGLPTA